MKLYPVKLYQALREKADRYHPLYDNIVFYFTLAFAIYTLFGRFTWLHGLVEHTINAFMYVFVGLSGVFLFALDFFFYKNYKKMPGYKISIVFVLCAFLSSALNIRYGVVDNISTLVWLTVQMGLFATTGHLMTRERYHKWLTLFFSISGAIWGFASAVSLYQFFFVRGYLIPMNGRMLRQSLYDNRLFGVFIDPNLGSFVGFLVLWGMVYLMYHSRKKIVRVLGIINCVLQFIYIILSGSRSTQVCLIISVSYVLVYLLVRHYKKQKTPDEQAISEKNTTGDSIRVAKKPNRVTGKCFRVASYIAAPVLFAALIFVSFSGLRTGMAELATIVSPEIHSGAKELERTDIEEDSSNNRIDIWKGYLTLLKDKPIFGLSPRNAWNYADAEHPGSYLSEHHYDVHNAYIAVLAGMGIVGFAVLIVMIVGLFRILIPRIFNTDQMDFTYFMALQLILNIAVFILFYPGIYFTNGIDTVLFWMAVGYATQNHDFRRRIVQ